MERWAHGAVGRLTTWPDPDGYVLVEGVLLRVRVQPGGLAPGAEVEVRHDSAGGRLVAFPGPASDA
ncbi:hypothetical protein [Streptomyces sp. NPDC008121]|uniref:hypothetical protein n=1 Tax=Streptomyces sp. NPDC008121 TaxID=3364809 RepID=UPI0036E9BDB1